MSTHSPAIPDEIILQGVGVSPGIAVGEAVVFGLDAVMPPQRQIADEEVAGEVARWNRAVQKTKKQIEEIRSHVAGSLGEKHALIFDAHLLVVDDPGFMERMEKGLQTLRLNVEAVLQQVTDEYTDALSRLNDEYLRERASDVRDVVRRMMKHLSGVGTDRMDQLQRPCIAVAHDFSPSDTAGMKPGRVHALVADLGSATSHTAIMARALEVPAVVGLRDASRLVGSGDTVLVDGTRGTVVVHPSSETLLSTARRDEEHKTLLCELETLKDKPSETLDGYAVPIAANIATSGELPSIARYGARGIGLFRSEFLFLEAEHLPDEDEQARVYAAAADACAPDSVVVRTLDLGGDKFVSEIPLAEELNPFLGWRAIRFCLANPDVFKRQLRAILRAGSGRNLALMYPMISHLDEVLEANRLLQQCREELVSEGVDVASSIPVGVMIEIPSAALTADAIAPHVDFFSIGTNDLVQYTLAVDRVNEQVAHLYQPTHLSILQLIRMVVLAGHTHRIPVGVCGQMAADPSLVPLLIGLGVDELSVSPPSIPMIKDVIRNLHYSDCRTLAKQALASRSPARVLSLCHELLEKTVPEILDLVAPTR